MGRYDSLTFPQVLVGCHLDAEAKRVRVMNVGLVKLVVHRPLEGIPKTATIQRSGTGTRHRHVVRLLLVRVSSASPPAIHRSARRPGGLRPAEHPRGGCD